MRSVSSKRIVRWLVCGLVLAGVLWLTFILGGRLLRRAAIARICELFPDTVITTGPIDFNVDGSVIIESLLIRPKAAEGGSDAILKAERVWARFGIGSLLLLRPRLGEVSVRGFVVDAQYDLDRGRWNIAALRVKSFERGGGRLPAITLERGTLKYSRVAEGAVTTVTAVPIDARFGPAEGRRGGYRFAMTTATMSGGLGKSRLQGIWFPGKITIAGGISSSDIPFFEKVWSVDVLAAELSYDGKKDYSLRLKIRDLVQREKAVGDRFAFDRQVFLKKVSGFTGLQRFFSDYRPRGQIDIELEASGNFERLSESVFSGKVYCKGVSVHNRKFPYLIDQLVGPIEFSDKGMSFNDLRGRHKEVDLSINGSFDDFGPNLRGEIRIASRNMILDGDLYDALDAQQKRLWRDFSPSGVVGMSYTLSRNPAEGKKYALDVELLGVEAKYAKFPYPLKNLTGRLFFDHDSIDVDNLVSEVGERLITINGQVEGTDTNEPGYDLLIKVRNVPLDSTLAAALPPAQRNLYNQFGLTGFGDGQIDVKALQEGPSLATFTADLDIKGASLRTQKPSVSITDVSAEAVVTPELVQIENLKGRYGDSRVWVKGRLWPGDEDGGYGYCLSVRAEQLDLTEDVLGQLPVPLKRIVSEVRPEGKVNVRADLNKDGRADCPDYKVVVECLDNRVSFEHFPYPLRGVRGRLVMSEDNIKLEGITATAAGGVQVTPGGSVISVDGEMALAADVFCDGRFRLAASDILFDERLGAALPGNIRKSYFKLSPTGRFDLNSGQVRVFSSDDGSKYVDFGGLVRFKGCNFDISPRITELAAELDVRGLYKIGGGLCNGQGAFVADGVKLGGKSVTKLAAKDIWYDARQGRWSTEDLVGDCHGGRLAGKFELSRSAEKAAEYSLQMGFADINLKKFLREAEPSGPGSADAKPSGLSHNGRSSGSMSGSLSVNGQIGDNYSRVGRCRLYITDMEVGKLSPLAKLLYVLKLTEPRDFAFDRMLVDSYIKQDKLLIELFDLSGEAIAFSGKGWMDLRTKGVDLTLTARGHRLATAGPSVLESLTEDIGLAVVRMEVTGDLGDVRVRTTALPIVKGAMEILGTEPIVPH